LAVFTPINFGHNKNSPKTTSKSSIGRSSGNKHEKINLATKMMTGDSPDPQPEHNVGVVGIEQRGPAGTCGVGANGVDVEAGVS
jgi:hypothetical protein